MAAYEHAAMEVWLAWEREIEEARLEQEEREYLAAIEKEVGSKTLEGLQKK